jgi:alkylation response protein AidB-like acyl-CoA dehydrogenase
MKTKNAAPDCLTPEARKIYVGLEALIPTIRAAAREGEMIGCLPADTVEAMRKTGLFMASVPLELGGYALGARDLMELLALVGRADGSAGWTTMISSGFVRLMMTYPDEVMEEVYTGAAEWPGPVVSGASLFSEKIQKGVLTPDGVIVKAGGVWGFGSGCKHAKFVGVGVEYDDEDGVPQRAMALLPKGNYEIVDDWNVMGLSGSSSNSVTTTKDVLVPMRHISRLADFGNRLDSIRTRYTGLGFSLDRLGLMLIVAMETMSIILGMAEGALEVFIDQAMARKPFNLPYEKIADAASTQVSAAKAKSKISAARALIATRADHIDYHAQEGIPFTPLLESEFIMDFAYAGSLAGQAIDQLQLTLGSSTVSLSNPIQRYARDARVALTHGSTRLEPCAEIFGRQLLGRAPFSEMAAVPGVSKANKKAAA